MLNTCPRLVLLTAEIDRLKRAKAITVTNLRSSWLGKAGTAATTETSPSLAVTKHARDLADETVKEQTATLRENARQAPKIIPKTETRLGKLPPTR